MCLALWHSVEDTGESKWASFSFICVRCSPSGVLMVWKRMQLSKVTFTLERNEQSAWKTLQLHMTSRGMIIREKLPLPCPRLRALTSRGLLLRSQSQHI